MAIEDVLVSFNPMDIVKGYEYGQERGRERESHEKRMEREQLLNDITRIRDLPAARLAGMDTGAKIGAFESVPGMVQESYKTDITTGYSERLRKADEEAIRLKTLPERMAALEKELTARSSPERTDVRIAGEAAGEQGRLAQSQYGATRYQDLQEAQVAEQEARTLMQQAEADAAAALQADPNAQVGDAWMRADAAIGKAKNQRTRELLMRRRDEEAGRVVMGAAMASDAETINDYLARYRKPFAVAKTTRRDQAGRDVDVWQVFQLQRTQNARGETVVTRVPVEGGFASANPNDKDFIGYQLPVILGVPGPAQPGARPAARTATPRQAGAPAPPKPTLTPPKEQRSRITGEPAPGTEAPGAGRPMTREERDAAWKLGERDKGTRPAQGAPAQQRRVPQTPAEKRSAIDALDDEQFAEVKRLTDRTNALAKLMASGEGVTMANGMQLKDLRERVDAILANPRGGQPAAAA